MQNVVSNIPSYKEWVIHNLAYITTTISSLYIMKTIYNSYSAYSDLNNLNKRVSSIIKIEIAKRKQEEKQLEKLKNENSHVKYNNQHKSDIYPNFPNEEIQAYFFNRYNNSNHNNHNTTTNIELKSTNSSHKQIHIEEEKKKKKDIEFYYYVYFKCLKTIYEKEFQTFDKKKLELFKDNNLLKYINLYEKHLNDFKLKEDHLLKQVFQELCMKDSVENQIKLSDIDTKMICYKYYEDLELEIPSDMSLEKLNEIVVSLFDQTKLHLNKVQNLLSVNDNSLSDHEYLLAESMAFDYVYLKYNFTENQIRKAIINNNLIFEIHNKKEE